MFGIIDCKCLEHRKYKGFCAVGLNWMLVMWWEISGFGVLFGGVVQILCSDKQEWVKNTVFSMIF